MTPASFEALRGAPLTDDVMPFLRDQLRRGFACALVTLIAVDGPSPRAVGAQMAVSQTGRYAGYISGGCLEKAIALEALNVIETGEPRSLRYGKGSPFLDIRLPCGSGLDIFIHPVLDAPLIEAALHSRRERQPVAFEIDLVQGTIRLRTDILPGPPAIARPGLFIRPYPPTLRCVVIGSTPIAFCLANSAAVAGFEVQLHGTEPDLYPRAAGIATAPLRPPFHFELDGWTAAILAFHDHDQEIPILKTVLDQESFFLTAIGSRSAQAERRAALLREGVAESLIGRIESPAGLIPGLKSAPHVAISVLARVIEAAQQKGLLASP